MIRVSVPDLELGGSGMARVVLVFQDEGTHGIRDVAVYDDDTGGTAIPVEQPPDCPPTWSVITPWLPRSRFPLFAEATDCDNVPTSRDASGPLAEELFHDGGPVDPSMPMPPMCEERCPLIESPACYDALDRVNEAADAMRPGCEECDGIRSERDDYGIALAIVGAHLFAVTLVLVFTANPIAALVLGIIALALAVTMIALAIVIEDLNAALRRCLEALRDLRADYQAALADVGAACCCPPPAPPAC